METTENIKKVSLFFFIIIGFTHIISSFIIVNQYLASPLVTIINRTLDMPFVVSGTFYGLASIRLNLSKYLQPSKIIDAALILLGIVVVAFIIYLNLLVPDKV